MLKIKLLRNLLLISLVIAVFFPAYEAFFVHPSYHHLLIEETEDEAVRYANYLAHFLSLENQYLTKASLPKDFGDKLQPVRNDSLLIKLRVFSSMGEILFSTDSTEIGHFNTKDYFREIVARGQVYSKIVKKDRKTADGAVAKRDVVETYVPFMVEGGFGGAFEVYYDITGGIEKVRTLTWHSLVISFGMVACFLLAIWVALGRAYSSLRERDKAEEALLQANEELEQRVGERTEELSDANMQLTNEIAERTLAQMALSEALEDSRRDREKLDGILRSVADGLVVTDGSLNVMHMNAAAEQLLDLPLERALGKSLGQVSKKVDFLREVETALAGPSPKMFFDFELSGDDTAAPHVYQARLFRLADEPDGEGLILLIRDVTREREVERMKNAFLGMAAHELNTPLATILGFTELLANQEMAETLTPEKHQEYLALVHTKALSLARLVDDLLDISQIESGRALTLVYGDFLLDELVQDVVKPYQDQNGQHDFELQVSGGGVKVRADQGRLRQVLDNLVSNAVKYSPGGGAIKVLVGVEGKDCCITVIDEGVGMTESQMSHMFDRFYRADSSNTAVQGVGLGMSIVQHIVDAHHGEIAVMSELNCGTTITVTIPLQPLSDDHA